MEKEVMVMRKRTITATAVTVMLAAVSVVSCEKNTKPEAVGKEVPGVEATGGAVEVAEEAVTAEAVEPVKEMVNEADVSEPVKAVKQDNAVKKSESRKSESKKPAAEIHTHIWKEHTASQQVWVPNIVTVDDYEEQQKLVGWYECECGLRFDISEYDVLFEHMETSAMNTVEKALSEGRNAEWYEFTCGRYLESSHWEPEKVKVGSHEEDHGHYETSTYVDYYYCECGARK